ncbi:hypothetical protein CYMTET_3671 [Cymbomonas tetramitiformis]|uniref:Uncharacterized protein n=1 Tax=Cymbomonas tetramitiformis TaxID=36881 RepID=A0AAE0H2N8_9CHLO|nr:hypothetical protein CYMTET_3671 [Cymbomonas tetramitiformis]|eukprot:gene1509-2143_t
MSTTRFTSPNRNACIQLVIFLAFYIQAVCVAYLTPSGDVSVTIDHAKYSEDGTRVQLERRELFTFNVVSLVYLFLLISAAQHSLQGLHFYLDPWSSKNYRRAFGVNWFRWSDYVITAPTMMVVVGIMNGVFDVVSLMSLFCAIQITIILGVLSDLCATSARARLGDSSADSLPPYDGKEAVRLARANFFVLWAWLIAIGALVLYSRDEDLPTYTTVVAYWIVFYFAIVVWVTRDGGLRLSSTFAKTGEEARKRSRTLFYVAIVPCAYAWTVVFVTFAYALDASEGNPPDFVYSINVVLLVLFLGPFPYVHYASLREQGSDDPAANESLKLRCEAAHAAFGLLSKSALAWMVYWGLRRLQEDVTISTGE